MIRKAYINDLLFDWISQGLDINIIATIFLTNNKLNLFLKEIIRLFSFWSELNTIYPLLNERYWNTFLGERFLMTLNYLDISIWGKFKSIFQLKKLIFAFLMHQKPQKGIKFMIKSLIR